MVMYYNGLKQRKIKFEPRIKLIHNIYKGVISGGRLKKA